jgi:hypothetical protein
MGDDSVDWGAELMRLLLVPIAFLALQGCVTSVVKEVVTAPIKVVSKTADVLTTSQSEADEKRGRAMRKREEELGKLSRKREGAQEDCDDGDRDACEKAESLQQQIDALKDKDI